MKKLLLLGESGLLVASAACAMQSGDAEQTRSSESSVTSSPAITSPSVTATSASIVVGYTHAQNAGPFTVTLTGPTGTYSQTEEATLVFLGQPTAQYGATFNGLADCAAFTWAVVSGATTLATGAIHTRATGNVACPASETLAPTETLVFRGVGHDFNNLNGLAWGSYPRGSSWNLAVNPIVPVSIGYTHFDSSVEWLVDARRARFSWTLDASQVRRATDAKVVATYELVYGQASCVRDIQKQQMAEPAYPITTVQTDNLSPWGNQTWATAMGAAATPRGLEPQVFDGVGLTFANGTATVNLGVPTSTSVDGGPTTITAGFFATGDGFPSQATTPPDSYYAQNLDQCMVNFDTTGLLLSYAPLAPDTPLGCSVAIDCNQATITCNAAGDQFVVHQVSSAGDVALAAVNMTGSPTTPFTQTVTQSGSPSYYVCTISGGVTSCTSTLPVTSNLACCASSTKCTSSATPPTITVSCPVSKTYYLTDSYTHSTTELGTGASYTEATSVVTTQSLVACPNGVSPGGATCSSFSTYEPKTAWCGPPPPPPACGATPKTSCSAGWHCCGHTWSCGLCQ